MYNDGVGCVENGWVAVAGLPANKCSSLAASAQRWLDAHLEAPTTGVDAIKWDIADTREECYRKAWHDSLALIERQQEELDILRKKVKASTEAYNILKASLGEA